MLYLIPTTLAVLAAGFHFAHKPRASMWFLVAAVLAMTYIICATIPSGPRPDIRLQ